jgi:hypothetical protein
MVTILSLEKLIATLAGGETKQAEARRKRPMPRLTGGQ